MIWNTTESRTRKEIEELQLRRLRWQVEYAYDHVLFYRTLKRFKMKCTIKN